MSQEPLVPARPELDEGRPDYMPRMPWKWIVLGVVALSILGGGYWFREKSKADAIRAEIVGSFEGELAPVTERYQQFRDKVEGWIMEAALQDPPQPFADPRLRISALHSGTGVYLRLGAHQATSSEGISAAAKDARRDGITRCLGIAPTSLRGFYETSDFLTESWREDARNATGVMRLRVLRDELVRRSRRDLPNIVDAMRSQYLLLVMQRGPSRRDAPVDVFMWDLRTDQKLLSLRTESRGMLLPVRIALPGVETPRARPIRDTMLADDCSIASQVKELTGEPAMSFGSRMPTAEPETAEPEAAEPEAAATDGAEETEEGAPDGEGGPDGEEPEADVGGTGEAPPASSNG